jgi:hypothetical protein
VEASASTREKEPGSKEEGEDVQKVEGGTRNSKEWSGSPEKGYAGRN